MILMVFNSYLLLKGWPQQNTICSILLWMSSNDVIDAPLSIGLFCIYWTTLEFFVNVMLMH